MIKIILTVLMLCTFAVNAATELDYMSARPMGLSPRIDYCGVSYVVAPWEFDDRKFRPGPSTAGPARYTLYYYCVRDDGSVSWDWQFLTVNEINLYFNSEGSNQNPFFR